MQVQTTWGLVRCVELFSVGGVSLVKLVLSHKIQITIAIFRSSVLFSAVRQTVGGCEGGGGFEAVYVIAQAIQYTEAASIFQ